MINLLIGIIYIICITSMIISIYSLVRSRKESFSSGSPKRIAVLLISATRNAPDGPHLERWKGEKRSWLRELSAVPQNVDIFFLESDSSLTEGHVRQEGNDLLIGGEDSYQPGIFNKTVAAIRALPGYDFYVRSNLSTMIDTKRLTQLLQHEKLDFYGGIVGAKQPGGGRHDIDTDGHIIQAREEIPVREPWTWVWGCTIVIGNKRAQSLLESTDDRFPSVIADDVLIGMYLQPYDKPVGILYIWDKTKSDEENIEQCQKQTPTFIRFRDASEASRTLLFDKFMM
jgi:hypothetical protein